MPHQRWKPVEVAEVPLPISGTYTRKGQNIVNCESCEVTCRWDGRKRLAYRVTSSTGRTVEWSPVDRARSSWAPKLTSTKGRKFPAEILNDDEVGRLIARCSRRAPTGIRNRALLVVLYRSGLRIGEALAIRPKDLDAVAGCIRILHGKGDKARTVGMDAGAFTFVDRWLDTRKKRGISGKAPLFCTLKGGKIHAAYIRAWLPRIAARAQIEKRVHAHALRHTHAAQLAAEGVPINVIQKQLGHANAAITSHYLDHISPGDVIGMIGARQWTGTR